jgi:hypothetical protein
MGFLCVCGLLKLYPKTEVKFFDAFIVEGPDGADYYKTIIVIMNVGLSQMSAQLRLIPDPSAIGRGRSTEKSFSAANPLRPVSLCTATGVPG